MRIAVLASGRGSNLKTILEHAVAGRLSVSVCLVLSNNPEAGALDIAKAYGVPVWNKSHKGMSRENFDREMLASIKAVGVEAVVLAGYMRILSSAFINAFKGKILNIHPALLPSFPGLNGGGDAVDYSVRLTGCTVHFVEDAMDNGPVVIQAAVPLNAGDSVEDIMPRIHRLEHRIYPQAIQWLAKGRLQIEGRKVRLLPKVGATLAPGACGELESCPWLVCPALEDF